MDGAPVTGRWREDIAGWLLVELTDIARTELGFEDRLAGEIAAGFLQGLRRRIGGQEVHIPAPDKAARDARIRAEFRGNNTRDLSRRYGLSRRRIYEIVAVSPLKTARKTG